VLATMLTAIGNLSKHVIRRQARSRELAESDFSGTDLYHVSLSTNAWNDERLRLALAHLTDAERDIIERRFCNDEPVRSIAKARGVKVQTIKELERRGLRRLRSLLAERAPEGHSRKGP